MEHILRPQADELGDVVFGYLRPKLAIFSTPNQDFNVIFNCLQEGLFRHWDHKFEMSRKQVCKIFSFFFYFCLLNFIIFLVSKLGKFLCFQIWL